MRTAIIIALLSLSSFSAIADEYVEVNGKKYPVVDGMVTLPTGEIVASGYMKVVHTDQEANSEPTKDYSKEYMERLYGKTDEQLESRTCLPDQVVSDELVDLCADMSENQKKLFKLLAEDKISVEEAEDRDDEDDTGIE